MQSLTHFRMQGVTYFREGSAAVRVWERAEPDSLKSKPRVGLRDLGLQDYKHIPGSKENKGRCRL